MRNAHHYPQKDPQVVENKCSYVDKFISKYFERGLLDGITLLVDGLSLYMHRDSCSRNILSIRV